MIEKIQAIAREQLADIMDRPGSILYSAHSTVSPGPVYLMGFNPGGSGGDSLRRSVAKLPSRNENAYLDENWKNDQASWREGASPLQKRVIWLLEQLRLEPKTVCASNLIFTRSRGQDGVPYDLADTCWPVHEAILEVVRPKLILAFGNSGVSPYNYLLQKLGGREDPPAESGHGSWKLKGFATTLEGRPIYVAGIPHLSRYSPVGKHQFCSWLETIYRS